MYFNVGSGKSENLNFDVLLFESILCLNKQRAEEVCVVTQKNNANFEEELTCPLKNDMKNLANFDPTLESLKICTLMSSF